jgi:steroid delta-isomerase-like uncharacterized protein
MPVEISQMIIDLFEAWNEHDVERAASLYSPSYKGYDIGRASPENGPEDERNRMARYLDAFPDLKFKTGEILVQGNQAAVVWTAEGTHQGTLMNIPPTGRSVFVRGMSLLTIDEDKIVGGLYVWDTAGLLRSIGLLPDL